MDNEFIEWDDINYTAAERQNMDNEFIAREWDDTSYTAAERQNMDNEFTAAEHQKMGE